MKFKFYVIEGVTAQNVIREYLEKKRTVKEKAREWSEKYPPLTLVNQSGLVATDDELSIETLKKYKLHKHARYGRNTCYYYWNRSAKQTEAYKEGEKIVNDKPSLVGMTQKATGLPLGAIEFEDGLLYTTSAYIAGELSDKIVCRIPQGEEKTEATPREGVREIKESEWLALMGR